LPRFIADSDGEKLKNFIDEAYGKNHILNNSTHYDWQFSKNPYSRYNKSVLVTDSDSKISCHVGLVPIELKVFNDIKSATWLISGFTLDRYRGKRLFSSIVETTSDTFDFVLVLSAGIEAQRVYKKHGWKVFDNLNRYVSVLNKNRFDAFVGKSSVEVPEIKDSSILKRITKIPDDYEIFWNKTKEIYPITTNRTKKYLNWRYLNHPLIDYHFVILKRDNKMVGYAVIRFETNNNHIKAARIIDLIVTKEHETELIKQILKYCNQEVDFVDFFYTGRFYDKILKEEKFYNNLDHAPMIFNPLDPNRKHDMNFQFKTNDDNAALNDWENWYMIKGDSDQDRAN